jgi:hypothetical protein
MSDPWTIPIDEKSVYVCKCGPLGPTKDSQEYEDFWRIALRINAGQFFMLKRQISPLFNLNWLNLVFPESARENPGILMWLAEVDKDDKVATGDTVESIYHQQLHVYWALSDNQRKDRNIVRLDSYRLAVPSEESYDAFQCKSFHADRRARLDKVDRKYHFEGETKVCVQRGAVHFGYRQADIDLYDDEKNEEIMAWLRMTPGQSETDGMVCISAVLQCNDPVKRIGDPLMIQRVEFDWFGLRERTTIIDRKAGRLSASADVPCKALSRMDGWVSEVLDYSITIYYEFQKPQ